MKIVSAIAAPLRRLLNSAIAPVHRIAEQQLMLQAQAMGRANSALPRLGSLHAAEFRAFSQWGEDGIISWLADKLPDIPRSFVEFGVQDYREANTRLLLQLRNWRGLLIDGSAEYVADIRSQDLYWRYDLTAQCAFVDKDNINSLIKNAGFSGGLGLLSIDVDGNDYWIWEAIETTNPAIVVCEYNAILGDRYALTVPYRADFQRSIAHFSNLYFGASIRALAALAARKGYAFVGTASTGCNAFFVRRDLAPAVLESLDGVWAFPSTVREARDRQGHLTFAGGVARKAIIDYLPLIDIETNAETTLVARGDVYSPEWVAGDGIKWV